MESEIETQLLCEHTIKVASNTNRWARVIFCFIKFPGLKCFVGTRIILIRLDNDRYYYYSKKNVKNPNQTIRKKNTNKKKNVTAIVFYRQTAITWKLINNCVVPLTITLY